MQVKPAHSLCTVYCSSVEIEMFSFEMICMGELIAYLVDHTSTKHPIYMNMYVYTCLNFIHRRRTQSRKSRLKPRSRKSTKQHKLASADISTQEATTPGSYTCRCTCTMYITCTVQCTYMHMCRYMYNLFLKTVCVHTVLLCLCSYSPVCLVYIAYPSFTTGHVHVHVQYIHMCTCIMPILEDGMPVCTLSLLLFTSVSSVHGLSSFHCRPQL